MPWLKEGNVRNVSYISGWGHSKEFFRGTDVRNYFSLFYSKMKTEVEQMSDEEIVSCDFEEWVTYLATKYSVVPLSLQPSPDSTNRRHNLRFPVLTLTPS